MNNLADPAKTKPISPAVSVAGLPCLNKNDDQKNAAAQLKNGADNQPVGAYKELRKKI
ncbi:MAG: hypothetical protein ACYS17_14060 [Planctomycetota bacterium]|jgi:hypothetical protein